MQQIEIELQQTIIKATTDGIIAELNPKNPGQIVNAGQEIVQILPSGSSLVIKAGVSPGDRSKLKLEQTTQIRVSACSYPDYGTLNGTLNGTIRQISEDIVKPNVKEAQRTSALIQQEILSAFYEVTIQPENLVLSQKEKHCATKLGMQGSVDIISREENVLQFFLREARLSTDF